MKKAKAYCAICNVHTTEMEAVKANLKLMNEFMRREICLMPPRFIFSGAESTVGGVDLPVLPSPGKKLSIRQTPSKFDRQIRSSINISQEHLACRPCIVVSQAGVLGKAGIE